MRGQPHTRSPLVGALPGNLGPYFRNIEGCASDGNLTTSSTAPLIVSTRESIAHLTSENKAFL